jgi:hypothetical protein
MFTRALLLLLAMMTGLSAAQAAEGVRQPRGTAEVSASASLPVSARAALDVKRQALSQFATAFPTLELGLDTACAAPLLAYSPAIACTHRADRARE